MCKSTMRRKRFLEEDDAGISRYYKKMLAVGEPIHINNDDNITNDVLVNIYNKINNFLA